MTNAQVEGAVRPVPMEHYYQGLGDGIWFANAYDLLLDRLPTDRPIVWVEVGVLYGQSLAYLGVEIINRNLPVTIHAVDNFAGWPGVDQGEALRDKFLLNTAPLRDMLGDRFQVHALPSVEASDLFAPDSCDVVWIDADHSYEAVKADIAAWWPKVKPGGYLGGDDWAFRGVREAANEAFPEGYMMGDGVRFQAPWPWWLVKK
ncbi:MAG TPA: class I SAM-dependent methyltransferase [Candidatus Krumholzibacteria bacterium]|nr:class I SAM-dependent methyltransferase [Candidatus Krumholzibacteria bacterium]